MARHLIPEYKVEIDKIVQDHPEVIEGKMFGCAAYYINKKMTLCLFDEYLFIKLPADVAAEAITNDENASGIAPHSGRSMGKEWVFLRIASAKDIAGHSRLIQMSFDYLRKLTGH